MNIDRHKEEIERENKLIIDMMMVAIIGDKENKSEEEIRKEQDVLMDEWYKEYILS